MIACKEVDLQSEESFRDTVKFNEASLEKLFNEEYVNLCSYFEYKFRFSHEEAKDAVHTGFVKLWESRELLASCSSVKMYLFKIIRNICLDLLKHRNVREKHKKHIIDATPPVSIDSPLENLNAKQLIHDIEDSLSNMPDQMRAVFKLSRYEGLKYTEIAAELNISIKTVETQMSRALERLRKNLSSYLKAYALVFILGS
jgi:RNA polymerase sigma-70 factor, ECF subfamily